MIVGLPMLLAILGVLVEGLVKGIVRVFPAFEHSGLLVVTKGILEFVVLWGFYSLLIGPWGYAVITSIVVTVVCDLTQPLLDRAVGDQRRPG